VKDEDDMFDKAGRLLRLPEPELWALVADWARRCKGSVMTYDEPAFYSADIRLDKVYHAGPPVLTICTRDWADWISDDELAEVAETIINPAMEALAQFAERKLAAIPVKATQK